MGKWTRFWLLGLIWGSSYLLIRISVEEMGPFQIVFIRTLIAAIGLNVVLFFRGKRLPREWKQLRSLIWIGIGNTVIPFLLITWGEKSVESGLASVLQSTSALFALLISHFAFRDERINVQKIAGITVGFVGIVVLGSRSWNDGQLVMGDLLGQMAIVLASLFYATFTTYSKSVMRESMEPVLISAGSMTTAAVLSGFLMAVAPLFGGPAPVALSEVSARTLVSVLALGFVNTLLAYLIFYSLVPALGAARTQMVTYVLPVVGLILGVIFLDEQLDARLIVGAALIFAGIGLVNLRLAGHNLALVRAPQEVK